MARQIHTIRTISSVDPADLSALGTTFNQTQLAADTVNKETIPAFTGREVIVAHNSGASPHTVTVDGVVKGGRSGSITAYSVPAGGVALIALPNDGWKQLDGSLHFEGNHAEILFSVFKYN